MAKRRPMPACCTARTRSAPASAGTLATVRTALTLGLALSVAGIATAPAHAQAIAQAATQTDRHRYDIPAGTLGQALNAYASAAGIELSADASLLAGKKSAGLSGSFTVQEGFARLLNGQGLQAVREANGSYTLSRAPEQPSAESATLLQAVTVRASTEGETATGPVQGYVARRSATGTKTDTAIIEVPQSLHVISARQMEDMGAITLTEALRQTPGVTVNPYGAESRDLDWVVLRGFDGWYSSSYRDGLVQNPGITFLGVPTEIYGLERLEVLLGPSSVLFGKGDAGGVVNRVSKLPTADMTREIEVQLGSYERKQLATDLGGAFDDDGSLRYRLVGLALDTGTQDQYPDGQRMERKRNYLVPSLRWDLSPQTSLILQAEHVKDDASDDVQYVTGADGKPTNIKEGDPRYSRIETESNGGGYQFEHRFDPDWSIGQKARYVRRTLDKHHILSWLDDDDVTLERQARHDVESVNEATIDTFVRGALRTGALQHGLLFGTDWDRTLSQWRRWQDMTASLDMNDPVYGIDIAEPTTAVQDTEITSSQLGFYAQDQLRWDEHWRITLGLRHDQVRTDSNDRFNLARSEQTDRATTGRAGVNYLLGNGWAPYASYAESFVPNIGNDSTGARLVPSDGRQLEAGIKYIPEDRPFSFSAAVFNLRKTNVVTYDPVTFDSRQIGGVRSRGVELSAKAELARELSLIASATVLDLKVLSSANPAEVGKTPILMPERTAALWLDYTVASGDWSGLGLAAGLRHIGKRWNDEANTASEPAYTLADASVRYIIGPWRFALNASNLFDKRYYAGHAYGSYYRGEERNLMLSAKYRW
ncbi:MAG: TonB-dependent siderophore receptor [Solimonas sp.]